MGETEGGSSTVRPAPLGAQGGRLQGRRRRTLKEEATESPLQLIQEKGSELTTQAGGPRKAGPRPFGPAVGIPTGRPVLDFAAHVVDTIPDVRHSKPDGHSEESAAVETEAQSRLLFGRAS